MPAAGCRSRGRIGETVLVFEHVTKAYWRHATRTFLRNHLVARFRRADSDFVHALSDVSLSLGRGESLAVIGPNGAGKSTLLNLVAQIAYPDEGRVSVRGRVGALLELGAGFHPDLTGVENVYLNASLHGYSRQRVHEVFDSIVDFAAVGDFIREPLRTYSTGMGLRLAFSVVVHMDPEILIIDEALAVGDQEFQAKCIRKIFEMRAAGKTLLCVAHAHDLLKQLCDRGVWLDKGRVVASGSVASVVEAYRSSVQVAEPRSSDTTEDTSRAI